MPHHEWAPSPVDATTFAAFRWFANAIENYCIDLYVTKRATRERVETILREALKELAYERAHLAESVDVEDCPPGYVLCDGICMPSCDESPPPPKE